MSGCVAILDAYSHCKAALPTRKHTIVIPIENKACGMSFWINSCLKLNQNSGVAIRRMYLRITPFLRRVAVIPHVTIWIDVACRRFWINCIVVAAQFFEERQDAIIKTEIKHTRQKPFNPFGVFAAFVDNVANLHGKPCFCDSLMLLFSQFCYFLLWSLMIKSSRRQTEKAPELFSGALIFLYVFF